MAEAFLSQCNFFGKNVRFCHKFPNLYTLEITASKLKDSMKNKTFNELPQFAL